MTKTTTKGVNEFHADKPLLRVPSIVEEFMDEGTRMYRMGNGSTYIADVYDRTLKPPVMKVEKRRTR